MGGLFRTEVELPHPSFGLSHDDTIVMLGSCFAENIGQKLLRAKFDVDINPYGIVYNPISVAKVLMEILACKQYAEADVFSYGGLWHSFMHHGSFSCIDRGDCIEGINRRIRKAYEKLLSADCLILTFGTAYVYSLDGVVVSNCHKLPEKRFQRSLASVGKLLSEMSEAVDRLFGINPAVKVICTVSPVRHMRDGFHNNQLSKSSLLLLSEELRGKYGDRFFYFPSYEIMMDELRDYRFYADDMLHPSQVAIDYVWSCFCKTFFSSATMALIGEFEKIRSGLQHRPLHPDSDEYRRFVNSLKEKIYAMSHQYVNLDFSREKEIVENL